MFSSQTAKSDGTLERLNLSLAYISTDDIFVTVDDVLLPTTEYSWTWVGNDVIQFNKPIANNSIVNVRRITPLDRMRHVFAVGGAIFKDKSVDENFRQLLYQVQEFSEGSVLTDLWNDLNMHGFRVRNMGVPTDSRDAITLGWYQGDKQGTWEAYQRSLTAAQSSQASAAAAKAYLDTLQSAILDADTALANSQTALTNSQTALTAAVQAEQDAVEALSLVESLGRPSPQVFNSVVQLSNAAKVNEGELVFVRGVNAGSTDGSGYFTYSATSTETPLKGIVVDRAAGGQFKRVLAGSISVLDGGAIRDGVTETHNEIKAVIQYAMDNGYRVYIPKGTYLIGNRIDPTLKGGKSIYIYGDGYNQTVLKERDGLTLELGRWCMIMYFNCPANTTFESITVKDIRFNKNGKTSPAPVDNVWLYEQAHCLCIGTSWTNARINRVVLENIVTEDKIGAGICFDSGCYDVITVKNAHGVKYQHIGGERGDFEFQAVPNTLTLDACTGRYIQSEPNVNNVPAGYTPCTILNNCTYDYIDFMGYSTEQNAQRLGFYNTIAKVMCLVRWAEVTMDNCKIRVTSSNNTFWQSLSKGSIIRDTQVTIGVVAATNTLDSFYPRHDTTNDFYLTFERCEFVADSTANATTTGFAINNALVYNGTKAYDIVFVDCDFSTQFERIANCYGTGNYSFIRCKLASRAGSLGCLAIGGYGASYSKVVLEDNDLSKVNGTFIQYLSSNALWQCVFKGIHPISKVVFTSNVLTNLDTCVVCLGKFSFSGTLPTRGIVGWVLRVDNPTYGGTSEYVCTVSGVTAAKYVTHNQLAVAVGASTARPVVYANINAGVRYFDITVGKPIVYDGAKWVDYSGNAV